MPAQGGPARRMTWLGPDVIVRGWTPEGRILFVTTHGQPFFRNYRAFTLGVDGGLPELLPYGQVNHLAYGPNGAKVIGRNTADPARWKRYSGGTAGHLVGRCGRQGRIPAACRSCSGNITSPIWLGNRIWFISDFEGVGNLYSCGPNGEDLQRHTEHADFYARHARATASGSSTSAARISGCSIRSAARARESRSRCPRIAPRPRDDSRRRPTISAAATCIRPATASPSDVRGKLFSFPLWEGAVRQHGAPDGVRYRLAQWLADGKTLVAVSDETGEERLQVFAEAAARTLDGTSAASSRWSGAAREAGSRWRTTATKCC